MKKKGSFTRCKCPSYYRYEHFTTGTHAAVWGSRVPDQWSGEVITGVSDVGPKWVRLAPNRQIRDFFRSYFSTFWLGEPKCAEIRSEKVMDLSHLGLI